MRLDRMRVREPEETAMRFDWQTALRARWRWIAAAALCYILSLVQPLSRFHLWGVLIGFFVGVAIFTPPVSSERWRQFRAGFLMLLRG
ncbi:MAG: hypothetical protein ACYDFV_10340 [Vulcanimicrobiaceae bacterium]